QSVGLGPADSLMVRYTPVALAWTIVLVTTGGCRVARRDWPRLLIVSLVGLSSHAVASVYGFAYVPAGIGGLIFATPPLFIALLAVPMPGERLSLSIVLGLVLAIFGTILLICDNLTSTILDKSYLWGILLMLLACFAWAIYSVTGKVISERYGPLPMTAMSTVIATVPMLALASRHTIDTLHGMTLQQWLQVLFLSGCSTFIAMLAWTYASAKLPATKTASSMYLIPVIAVLSGVLFLHEALTWSTMFGGLCIVMGVAVAQFGPRPHFVGENQADA
ncbi:MAG TPA: DMT family transporter, partial [Candidatus Udaeobacter sp.]|nr:DMT family transporter [Candidatus Udaeobacter sp.]